MTGAMLTRMLKASGTGERWLKVCRRFLKEKNTASAEEVAKAIQEAGAGETTLKKCEDLINFGEVQPPAVVMALEDELILQEQEDALEKATAPGK